MTRRFRARVLPAAGGLDLTVRVPPRNPASAPAAVDPLDVLIDAPDGTVGVPYAHTYTATGGTPPYTWALTPGTPDVTAEMPFDPVTGSFAGTPTTEATYQFRVELADAAGNRVRAGDAIRIAGVEGPLTLSGEPPDGTVGVPYSFTWTITGGVPPYTVSQMNWTTGESHGLVEDLGPPPSVSGTVNDVLSVEVEIEIFVQDSADPPNTVSQVFSWAFV